MLAELDDRKIEFITLRARHPGITEALAALPVSAWKPMTLGRAVNKTRRIRVHDDPATALSAYPRPIRQLAVTGLGHVPRRGPKARPANAAITAATTLSVPPYRNHLPGVVAVMITVPLATGMDSTNDAMIQPIPGSSAPLTERMAQAASTQVSRMTTQHASAATGTGLGTRLYWKLPMMPSTTPAMNSTP